MQDDFGNLISVERDTIDRRLDKGAQRMGRIESDVAAVRAELQDNTRTTNQLAASTADLVEFFEAMRGAFKVLNWIGTLAKPLGAIAALGAAVLAAIGAAKGMR